MNASIFASMATGVLLLVSGTPMLSAQAAAAPVSIAPPAHPATEAQIREYLAVTHADENAHALMAQSLQGMRATGNPAIPSVVWDDMGVEFAKFDIITPMIPAYQRYLSQEDMATIIAFYKTDAGQRILQSQPFIVSASQDTLRKMGEQVGRQIVERHKDEIAARAKELEAARSNGGAAKPEIIVPDTKK